MKTNFSNQGQSLIAIIIVLVVVGLITGSLYYYLSKQIPEIPEITKKPAEEVVTPEEITLTLPPEEELVPEEIPPEEKIEEKPAEKPIIQKCPDGTLYGQCSVNKPKYCENGNLIEKASLCGCPSGYKISDNQCVIDVSKTEYKKIGIVYVSESDQTYNPNWRTELYFNKSKIENGLNNIFSKKGIKFVVDFMGEFRANNLCWNPRRIAFIQEFIKYPGSLEKGWYTQMPGSELSEGVGNYICNPKDRKTLWSDCPPARCEEFNHPDFPDSQCFRVKCDQKFFTLSLQNPTWIDPLLNNLEANNFNFSNYDYKVIILGKAGPNIPQIGEKEKYHFCRAMTVGDIMGYTSSSNLIVMTENGLRIPSYYKCPDFTKLAMPGWQQIIHEILHTFGAVDVYEFDWQKNPSREEALKLELEVEVEKSIMANGWFGYCNKHQATYSCKPEDLEKIYLDKYNRIKLGLE
ncbi:MAG: hypothetical protein QME57_00415 [Patescibacteria group bacterium]|nr:hypothetical protein [Patescibacteria group bacterium]